MVQFDVAVLRRDEESGDILRLIHDKKNEVTYWNQKPDEKNLDFYELVIKKAGCWKAVRELYLQKKNMYLERQDQTHPSRVVYREAIHQVYQSVKVK